MKKEISEYLDKVFELDTQVEEGVYCAELDEDDLKAFAEHAKKRKKSKDE